MALGRSVRWVRVNHIVLEQHNGGFTNQDKKLLFRNKDVSYEHYNSDRVLTTSESHMIFPRVKKKNRIRAPWYLTTLLFYINLCSLGLGFIWVIGYKREYLHERESVHLYMRPVPFSCIIIRHALYRKLYTHLDLSHPNCCVKHLFHLSPEFQTTTGQIQQCQI